MCCSFNMALKRAFSFPWQVLLTSDKAAANFSDRSLLKNLGHWLGMITLAKNKPILYTVRLGVIKQLCVSHRGVKFVMAKILRIGGVTYGTISAPCQLPSELGIFLGSLNLIPNGTRAAFFQLTWCLIGSTFQRKLNT